MGAGAEIASGICICDDGADLEAGASGKISMIKNKEEFLMLKLVIRFDEEKIKKEQVCTLEMLYAKIDRAIRKANLKKVENGIYTDTGNKMDLTRFFGIIAWLKQMEWFHRYVIQMDWYNDRCGTKQIQQPEDMLEDIALWDTI